MLKKHKFSIVKKGKFITFKNKKINLLKTLTLKPIESSNNPKLLIFSHEISFKFWKIQSKRNLEEKLSIP